MILFQISFINLSHKIYINKLVYKTKCNRFLEAHVSSVTLQNIFFLIIIDYNIMEYFS